MFAFNNLIHTLVLPPQLISYLFDCVFPRPPFFTHFISLSRFPLYGFHLIKQRLRSKFLPLEWNTEYGISLEARGSLNQVLLLLSFSFDLFRVFACKATGRRTRRSLTEYDVLRENRPGSHLKNIHSLGLGFE